MSSEEKPTFDFGPAGASPSVEHLIFQLKSSFFNSEFDKVANILTERERQVNRKSAELERKAQSFEKEKSNWGLEKLRLEDELKKKERAFAELKVLNYQSDDKMRVLESEVDMLRKSKLESEAKIRALELKERKAQDELEAYKKLFLELDGRVSSLEKTSEVLMGTDLKRGNEEEKNDCVAESSRAQLFGEEGALGGNAHPKSDVILIDDDDDEKPDSKSKRKRVLSAIKREESSDDDDDTMPIGRKILKSPQQLHPTSLLRSSLDGSHSKSDSESDDVDDIYDDIFAKMGVPTEGWRVEADMTQAFDKDNELCMNGICALYRQRGKLASFASASDISRVTKLAKLLIDGDPQQKLKKLASELDQSDVDDCRKFAKMFSRQLFSIFQKKEDPFFPSSRS